MEFVQAPKVIKKTFQGLVHWCKFQKTLNDNVKNLNPEDNWNDMEIYK